MLFEQILFFAFGALALAGALGVVVLKNPFYSVLALVTHLFSLAGLFLLLQAEFIAFAQVVVYVGAVMVLYIFVVAYIGGADEPLSPENGAIGRLGPVFAVLLLVELTIAVVGSGLGLLGTRGVDVPPAFGTPAQIGELLLTKFLLPFEAASFLLLVAAIGAVVLARRRRGLEEAGAGAMTGLARRTPAGSELERREAKGGELRQPTEPVRDAEPAGVAASGESEGQT